MKKIKIKCATSNGLYSYKYHIKIFDKNDILIFEGNTSLKENYIIYDFPSFDIYKIIIYSSQNVIPGYICKNVYIHKNICSTLLFLFEIPSKKKNIPKKCYLTDKNYKGLPIMKGEMILWPNHM